MKMNHYNFCCRKPAETQTSIRLASHLVRAPNSKSGGHEFESPGPPIASKFRKLDGEKLKAAKAEFKQREQDVIIQQSTSPWSSLLHMVSKSDGNGVCAAIFAASSLVTKPDVYPLPNMLDFAAKGHGLHSFPQD